MFTGIIQDVGMVLECRSTGGDLTLRIGTKDLDLTSGTLGESICVHGVCLTVTRCAAHEFQVDVSRETLAHTTLGAWEVGTRVNLERALRVGDALGGHFVSGHVDGTAEIRDVRRDARSMRIEVAPPRELRLFFARKGSVALDGVSLTVNEVSSESFGVNLIPHTQTATTLGHLRAGGRVNLEIDPIARYLERWLQGDSQSAARQPSA